MRLIALIIAALSFIPAVAHAQFQPGNWELTLSGSGSNDRDLRDGNAAVNGSLGYFLTNGLEVGVRQAFAWGGGSNWSAATVAAADLHLDAGRWQPFIGANIGYSYGGGDVADVWSAGPEAGVKFFVNDTTFIFAMAQYEFDIEQSISTGAWFYTAGVGFKF